MVSRRDQMYQVTQAFWFPSKSYVSYHFLYEIFFDPSTGRCALSLYNALASPRPVFGISSTVVKEIRQ